MNGKHLYDDYLFHEAFLEYNKPVSLNSLPIW